MNKQITAKEKLIYERDQLRKWKEFYPENQEELNKNFFIRTIFDLGHRYIASMGKAVCGKILDVGSGSGYHLKFEEISKRRTYICLDPEIVLLDKIAQKNVVKIQAGCENIPLKPKSVDVIIASHILEHVTNLRKCVNELKRVLKDEGLLLVVLPCDPGVAWKIINRITPSRKRLRKKGLDYDIVMRYEHPNTFNKCIKELTREFKVEEEKYYPFLIKNHNFNFISCIKLVKRK